MGMLLCRFRKKKTTVEVLEDLDTKIKAIEQYEHTTEQRHKKIVGTLILYSVLLYMITAFLFYFCFFPASLYDQIFYIIPLLTFPILILFTKKMVSWYYKRKISYNREKLTTMESEKKKILEEVTETETYKKAKEILMKYAPDQLSMAPLSPQPAYKVQPTVETPRRSSTPQTVHAQVPGLGSLRRRVISNENPPITAQSGALSVPGVVPVGLSPTHNPQSSVPLHIGPKPSMTPAPNYRTPLPRPVLPRQRSYLDRLIDYIVGDGPSNRYALICRNCESHNGMSLKEEFEYFGFRCCYCNFWNPARKQKPSAPKLDYDIVHHTSQSDISQHTSGTTNSDEQKLTQTEAVALSGSETDSDIEVVERPETNDEATEKNEEIPTHEVQSENKDEVTVEKSEKMDVDESM